MARSVTVFSITFVVLLLRVATAIPAFVSDYQEYCRLAFSCSYLRDFLVGILIYESNWLPGIS